MIVDFDSIQQHRKTLLPWLRVITPCEGPRSLAKKRGPSCPLAGTFAGFLCSPLEWVNTRRL
ncbi:hypothetical protein RB2043 [Rhodopirellula baltica SH 1]|uniref:Uncharacterized protein n=1 Tax=Rhodopirellula baltica (strain DSM 10527 / NCIMB 13988 / SH1) TaxID=243090 RepID=Q7UWH1_RHOBA|nr:hypothetical protein RB2043 [Rhodopirellula baltica SH 1]